jgi:hypothetical protein
MKSTQNRLNSIYILMSLHGLAAPTLFVRTEEN